MGAVHNFTAQHTPYHDASAHVTNPLHLLTKRAGLRLAGAFAFVGAAAALVLSNQPATAPSKSMQASPANNSSAPVSTISSSAASSTNNIPSPDSQTPSLQATTQTTGNGATRVTVNGQSIDVPAGGSTHQTLSVPGGQATLDVNSNTSSSGSSTNSSSLNISSTTVNDTNGTTSVNINSTTSSP